MNKKEKIKWFRKLIEKEYLKRPTGCGGSFGELLCWEIHCEPINPRMQYGMNECGFTFKELASKWGISVTFLGELIADHCKKLEEIKK